MKLEDEILQKHFRNEYHKATVNVIFSYNWLVDYQVKLFKPYGITMQQYNILRILRGQYPKPATIKLIKERMLDKMSDASRIVEKLRLKGLVERNICSNDNRFTINFLVIIRYIDSLSDTDKYFFITKP